MPGPESTRRCDLNSHLWSCWPVPGLTLELGVCISFGDRCKIAT